MNFKTSTSVQNLFGIIFLFTILSHDINSAQGLSAKNSEILRKGIQPSVLGNPIEDDEAFSTLYDGPEDPSTAPGCPTRQGEPIRGMCDCDDAGSFTTAESFYMSKNKTFCIHEKRNLAYYPPKKRCYYLFERGPCPFGQWLILNPPRKRSLRAATLPQELVRHHKLQNTILVFYDPLRDSCYQAYTRGYCPRNHLLIPTKTNWLPQCMNTKVKCDDLLQAIVAIPTLRCSLGSYCSQILDGRKHHLRSKISRRHRHRTY
ncbi:hypothetical protein Ocin01_11480 [Orchesella cincta]|uniref:DUF4789 domain-containing protein n=1 Tax=Orchesella cincta TaxID=48709 RepID=A0A1D2MQR0_ORCCI|nr:hypothetical protein Ocin01_11480 [Orchesella cincta]